MLYECFKFIGNSSVWDREFVCCGPRGVLSRHNAWCGAIGRFDAAEGSGRSFWKAGDEGADTDACSCKRCDTCVRMRPGDFSRISSGSAFCAWSPCILSSPEVLECCSLLASDVACVCEGIASVSPAGDEASVELKRGLRGASPRGAAVATGGAGATRVRLKRESELRLKPELEWVSVLSGRGPPAEVEVATGGTAVGEFSTEAAAEVVIEPSCTRRGLWISMTSQKTSMSHRVESRNPGRRLKTKTEQKAQNSANCRMRCNTDWSYPCKYTRKSVPLHNA